MKIKKISIFRRTTMNKYCQRRYQRSIIIIIIIFINILSNIISNFQNLCSQCFLGINITFINLFTPISTHKSSTMIHSRFNPCSSFDLKPPSGSKRTRNFTLYKYFEQRFYDYLSRFPRILRPVLQEPWKIHPGSKKTHASYNKAQVSPYGDAILDLTVSRIAKSESMCQFGRGIDLYLICYTLLSIQRTWSRVF